MKHQKQQHPGQLEKHTSWRGSATSDSRIAALPFSQIPEEGLSSEQGGQQGSLGGRPATSFSFIEAAGVWRRDASPLQVRFIHGACLLYLSLRPSTSSMAWNSKEGPHRLHLTSCFVAMCTQHEHVGLFVRVRL
jgi:hypothetical protein